MFILNYILKIYTFHKVLHILNILDIGGESKYFYIISLQFR